MKENSSRETRDFSAVAESRDTAPPRPRAGSSFGLRWRYPGAYSRSATGYARVSALFVTRPTEPASRPLAGRQLAVTGALFLSDTLPGY